MAEVTTRSVGYKTRIRLQLVRYTDGWRWQETDTFEAIMIERRAICLIEWAVRDQTAVASVKH